jgi:hypothetical protein
MCGSFAGPVRAAFMPPSSLKSCAGVISAGKKREGLKRCSISVIASGLGAAIIPVKAAYLQQPRVCSGGRFYYHLFRRMFSKVIALYYT